MSQSQRDQQVEVGATSKRTLLGNFMALLGVQAANYVLPLITIPYLTRVLGPESWGVVAQVQGMALLLIVLIEFGFVYSATRAVAEHRHEPQRLRELLGQVFAAKLCLATLAMLITMVIWLSVPNLRGEPWMLAMGWSYALLQGLHPLWFFQGMERMKWISVLDIVAKSVTALGIFGVVQSPDHGWRVLAMQACGALISTSVGSWISWRMYRWQWANRRGVWEVLAMGWNIAVFRGAVSLYAVSQAFLLGLIQPPTIVAYYAGPEKICKAVGGLFAPLSQTLYPRLSYLLTHEPARALRWARLGVLAYTVLGVMMGAVLFGFANPIIRLLLGEGYEAAGPVLRVLAWSVPMIALSNMLGIVWMFALKMDAAFNRVVLSAGLLNLGLASLLAWQQGAVGMAWASVLIELFVTAGVMLVLRWTGKDPLSLRLHAAQAGATVPWSAKEDK